MKKIVALYTVFTVSVLGAEAALAASPAYCRLYAREVVKLAAIDSQVSISNERIQDSAYYKCLNMDDEPVLPTADAGSESDGVGGPFVEATEPIAPAVDQTIVEEIAAPQSDSTSPQVETKKPTGKWRGSGLAAWSTEWKKWCAEHFPNSFDADTGTVIPYKTGERTICR